MFLLNRESLPLKNSCQRTPSTVINMTLELFPMPEAIKGKVRMTIYDKCLILKDSFSLKTILGM